MKRRDDAVEATIRWMDQAAADHRGALPRLRDEVSLITADPYPEGDLPGPSG